MEDLLPVNVLVGDRTYRLRVKPSDEEHLRKTVKIINDKIIEYKTQFAGKNMQDYISMVLLWFATEYQEAHIQSVSETEATDKIASLNQLIKKALAPGTLESDE